MGQVIQLFRKPSARVPSTIGLDRMAVVSAFLEWSGELQAADAQYLCYMGATDRRHGRHIAIPSRLDGPSRWSVERIGGTGHAWARRATEDDLAKMWPIRKDGAIGEHDYNGNAWYGFDAFNVFFSAHQFDERSADMIVKIGLCGIYDLAADRLMDLEQEPADLMAIVAAWKWSDGTGVVRMSNDLGIRQGLIGSALHFAFQSILYRELGYLSGPEIMYGESTPKPNKKDVAARIRKVTEEMTRNPDNG